MDESRYTLLLELPPLSDQAACELLDLVEQLFAGLDRHYFAQAARYRHRLHEQQPMPPEPLGDDNDDPF